MGGWAGGRRKRGYPHFRERAYGAERRFPPVRRRTLGPRPPSRRVIRRVMAHATSERDDGAGLEFPGRPFPLLYPRSAGGSRRAALRGAQRRAGDDRVHASDAFPIQPLDCLFGHGAGAAARGAVARRRQGAGAASANSGLLGLPMTSSAWFGAALDRSGVTFRLWAPAAKHGEAILDRAYPRQRP